MRLYSENKNYKLYQGNMLDMLEVIEPETIDSIVCDPPYELNFMSKNWDNSGIAFQPSTWQKCYEVLKPGGYLLAFGGSRTFHRIACAIEDAGFEIRDTIMWLYGCLSNDTEILTSNGWKKSDTITIGDEIYSLDLEKDIIIKNKCLSVFKYDYDGEMVNLKNNNTNQLLTPNHHCIIKDKIKTQIKGKTNYNTHDYWCYKDAWQIRSQTVKLPLASNYNGTLEIGNLFAELLGWVISEGTYLKDTNAIMITQSSVNKEYVKRIRYILGKLKIKYNEYARERKYKNKTYIEYDFYLGKQAEKYVNKIKKLAPNKKLTWDMLELSLSNKEFLIKGLLQGDGTKDNNLLGFSAFNQKELEQLQIFQALLHLTNKQGWINENKHSCSIHNNPNTELQGKHFKNRFVKYNAGYVWCIETEVGNFIAKRDGKIFITGNSGFPKSMDISKQIDKKGGNDYSKQFAIDLKQARESRNLTMKYCDDKYCNSSTNWSWYEGRKDGCRVPDYNTYLEIIKEFPELEKYRELIKEAEREVIGTKKGVGCFTNDEHYTVGGTKANDYDITIPSTDLAKQWQGWGTCLKPSFEPIIVARKPFKGSLVDNVIEYGVGGINIDECRVGNETIYSLTKDLSATHGNNWGAGTPTPLTGEKVAHEGRFPANTILTYDETDFDEVCGGFPNTRSSGNIKGEYYIEDYNNTSYSIGGYKNNTDKYKDSGSTSRYFMNCKYTGKDEEIWKQLLVNNVGNNLEILKATKDNIVQMNVEDLLKELKDHYAKYVDNQLDLTETSIVQDIVKMLTWDFKIETSQVIQGFILNYKQCTQFLNLVQFVEKMDNIDTTQTTQNLLKLFGYVKVAITNYIVGNFTVNELDQKRYTYQPKASKKDRDEGIPNKWLDNIELILYNNIGDELWKDKITIKEANKAKHLEDMEASLKKVIEEYGMQTKKDIDLNMLSYGKKSLEKYLMENKYTTKTGINSTTILQILNLLNLCTTKENTQDVNLETMNGGNLVEIVENLNQLQIIIKENQELVHGVNNVVLKMQLKINEKEGRNEHCTVKPTELMQYLVRLVSPDGATILDPFNGSGSTGKAVMYENKERNKEYKYIGIELTEEYLPIAKARIEYVCNLKEEKSPQMSIFDLGGDNNE